MKTLNRKERREHKVVTSPVAQLGLSAVFAFFAVPSENASEPSLSAQTDEIAS